MSTLKSLAFGSTSTVTPGPAVDHPPMFTFDDFDHNRFYVIEDQR